MQGWHFAHTYSHLTVGNYSDLFNTVSEFRGGGTLRVCIWDLEMTCFFTEIP